jgi:hypothetical protein
MRYPNQAIGSRPLATIGSCPWVLRIFCFRNGYYQEGWKLWRAEPDVPLPVCFFLLPPATFFSWLRSWRKNKPNMRACQCNPIFLYWMARSPQLTAAALVLVQLGEITWQIFPERSVVLGWHRRKWTIPTFWASRFPYLGSRCTVWSFTRNCINRSPLGIPINLLQKLESYDILSNFLRHQASYDPKP